jgi:hypothetical protein
MKLPAVLLILALVGCSSRTSMTDGSVTDTMSGDGMESDTELCGRLCAVTGQVSCPDQPQCMPNCLHDLQATICPAESRAGLECVISVGVVGFQCDSSVGLTVVKTEYCTQEREALFACLRGN